MNYAEFLESNPSISGGQVVMKGTRVPLRTVLASLAEGDTRDQLLRSFPSLTQEHLQAAMWVSELHPYLN